MNSSWFFEHNFNGVPDDFFDDVLKYFDFPLENLESNDAIEDWESQFQHVPTPFNLFADCTSGIRGQNFKDPSLSKSSVSSDNKSSRPKPWLRTAKASSSRNIPLKYDPSEVKYARLLWTSSPVSVLESSSSSSSTENLTACSFKFTFPVKRPRSKCLRRRRCTFPFIPMFYPKQHILGAYESESESCPDVKLNLAKRRKKKKNLTLLSSTVEMDKLSLGEIRKCSHCEVTKTPQWREGPMGPKTLCNACGVRYRSGRLFPEYRPAASPTFVPMLHSNSHRKVIEMRKDAQCSSIVAATKTAKSPLPEYSF